MAFVDCLRRFSQIVLIIINIIIVLFGFATMVIGIWAKVDNQVYFEITNNSSVAQLSILLIIVGLFIMIVGGTGSVGAIFASTVFGRITLGLYSVVLALLVFCEVVAGIAAAVEKGQLESVFRKASNDTFQRYNGSDVWNDYEKQLHCCGVNSWKDYRLILNKNEVPVSCCNPAETAITECDTFRINPDEQIADQYFYTTGCADAVINGVKSNLGAIAGGAIVLGIFQIVGIVMACFVAIYNSQDSNKYEVV